MNPGHLTAELTHLTICWAYPCQLPIQGCLQRPWLPSTQRAQLRPQHFLFCLPVMNPEPPERPHVAGGQSQQWESGSVRQPNYRAGVRGRTSRPLHLPSCLAGNRLLGVSNVRRWCCLPPSLGDSVALHSPSSFPLLPLPSHVDVLPGCWAAGKQGELS